MKNINKLFLGLLLLCSLSFSYADDVQFYNPSFDCSKVKKDSVEYLICTDKDLSYFDWKMGKIYDNLLENSIVDKRIALKEQQKDWLKNRDKCNEHKCFRNLYLKRISFLQNQFLEKNTLSDKFTYLGKPILPACVYELLSDLNGDHLFKKIDLTNCMKSEKYSDEIEIPSIKELNNKQFLFSEVDEKNWGFMYFFKEYLGCNIYELETIGYPLDGGSIVSEDILIISIEETAFYNTILENNNINLINDKYYEMKLLTYLSSTYKKDLFNKYENIKNDFIAQCKKGVK
jgi:uncharacterized protein